MMVRYKCNLCPNEIDKLYDNKYKRPPFLQCECGGVMEKQRPDFGTSSIETVDTGTMARKVELRKDAVNRFKEKGDIHIKKMENRGRPLKKDED